MGPILLTPAFFPMLITKNPRDGSCPSRPFSPPQPRVGRREVPCSLLRRSHPPPHFYCTGLAFLHIPTGGKFFQVLNPLPTCYPFLFLSWGGENALALLSSLPSLSSLLPTLAGRLTGRCQVCLLTLASAGNSLNPPQRELSAHPSSHPVLPPRARRGLARQEEPQAWSCSGGGKAFFSSVRKSPSPSPHLLLQVYLPQLPCR